MTMTRGRSGEQQSEQGGQSDHQSVLWGATFTTPWAGMTEDGTYVMVQALGDQPGSSPVYLVVDEQGQSRVLPIKQITALDRNVLPLGQQQQELISSRLGGTSGGSNRR